jgi:hypothetical protein
MQTKSPPKRGRSSGYSAEIAETICGRLINGESLRAICADPAMPARATVFRWLASDQEFRRSYAFARECQAEDMLERRGHKVRLRCRKLGEFGRGSIGGR